MTLWYELSGRLAGSAGVSGSGRVPNLAGQAGASAVVSGKIAPRARVAGAGGATAGVSGDPRLNRYRGAAEADAAGAIAGQPLKWQAASNFSNVRSQGVAPVPDAIAVRAAALTPNDLTTFMPTRWIWIGGIGDVAVVMNDGSQIVFPAVPAGTRLPISIVQLLGNTTATNVIACY